MLAVMLGWALFYFEDLGALGLFLGQLFTPASSASAMPLILGYLPLLLCGALASTPVLKKLNTVCRNRSLFSGLEMAVLAVLLVLCIASLASMSYNPFIYFRF